MTTNALERQVPKPESSVIAWLLDSDTAIRWQTMRDLTDASTEEVAAARAQVATTGWGAQLLALQQADGSWPGVWDATMHALSLLRDMGLDPTSEQARQAVELVRGRAFLPPHFYTCPTHSLFKQWHKIGMAITNQAQ